MKLFVYFFIMCVLGFVILLFYGLTENYAAHAVVNGALIGIGIMTAGTVLAIAYNLKYYRSEE